MNKKLIAVLLSIFLFSFMFYVLSTNSTTYVNEYSALKTASYIIYKDGSTIVALSGTTSALLASGTNASYVIQHAIDATASTGMGSIHIREGEYDITNTIILRNGITLLGIYKWTQLKAKNLNGDMLKTAIGAMNIHIANILLWGRRDQADGQTNGNGINIYGDGSGYRTRLENLIITYTSKSGIEIGGSTGATAGTDMHIVGSDISYSGEDGIHVGTASGSGNDLVIERNTIHHNLQHGIHLRCAAGDQIIGNNIYGNTLSGISEEGEGQNQIIGNKINANGQYGIKFGYANRDQIIGNEILDNSQTANNTYYGIRIEGGVGRAAYNTISNNYIGSSSKVKVHIGIYLGDSADYNLVTNNIIKEVGNVAILNRGGANNKIWRNIGFVTENSGTATISSSISVTFNHGLAGTPTFVSVSFNATGWRSWKWRATSTQITVTVEARGTYLVYWSAEYRP